MNPACASCPLTAATLCGANKGALAQAVRGLRRTVRHYQARDTILLAGEPAQIMTVRSGWVAEYSVQSDGRRLITGIGLPGDPVALECIDADALPYSIQALTPVTTCSFDVSGLRETLPAAPAAARGLIQATAERMAILRDRVLTVGARNASEAFARLVLDLHRRLLPDAEHDGDAIPWPLTQEMVADALGLTKVHVGRTLTAFRADGIIELADGRLRVRDMRRLRRLASLDQATRPPGS